MTKQQNERDREFHQQEAKKAANSLKALGRHVDRYGAQAREAANHLKKNITREIQKTVQKGLDDGKNSNEIKAELRVSIIRQINKAFQNAGIKDYLLAENSLDAPMDKGSTTIEQDLAFAHGDLIQGINVYVKESCEKGRAEPGKVKTLAKLAGIMVVSFCVASVSSVPLALAIAAGGALIVRNDMTKAKAASERNTEPLKHFAQACTFAWARNAQRLRDM